MTQHVICRSLSSEGGGGGGGGKSCQGAAFHTRWGGGGGGGAAAPPKAMLDPGLPCHTEMLALVATRFGCHAVAPPLAISDIHRSSVHENVLAPFDFVYVS